MPKYQGDPRWVTVRYPGTCSGCGNALAKGSQAYFRPNGKRIYGQACCGAAEDDEADFNAHAFDEDFGNQY